MRLMILLAAVACTGRVFSTCGIADDRLYNISAPFAPPRQIRQLAELNGGMIVHLGCGLEALARHTLVIASFCGVIALMATAAERKAKRGKTAHTTKPVKK